MDTNWLPAGLMDEDVQQSASVAQRVKQMLILLAGIELKRQSDMSKGEQSLFILTSYNNWCDILRKKYPKAAIHKYMAHITGKLTTHINGAYLRRNFQEGLRIYHNQWNPLWAKCLAGQTSGKSGADIWNMFVYRRYCESKATVVEDVVPASFDVAANEHHKWVLAYKQLGPPCNLFPPCPPCHELLANAKDIASRGTGTKKRKADKVSRSTYREKKSGQPKLLLPRRWQNAKLLKLWTSDARIHATNS